MQTQDGSLHEQLSGALALLNRNIDAPVYAARVSLQYLQAVSSGSYADVASGATSAWLSPRLPGQLTDCAVLVDGTDASVGGRYQAEYGVVDAEQAGKRLDRNVGRMRDVNALSPRRTRARRSGCPEVAIFCDVVWWSEPEFLGDGGGLTTAWEFSERARAFSGTFLEAVHGSSGAGSGNVTQEEVR